MIQLHRLEGFYWVVRERGYARAARAFPYPITQSALHQQVKKLEQEVGVTLLERVGKDEMKPTPAGEHLWSFVAPFFEGLPPVVRAVQEGEHGGEIRLAAAPLSLRSLLPAWLKRLRKSQPRLLVHLIEAPDHDLAPLLRGEIDLKVDWFPSIPASCASLQVGTMRPFVVVPRAHPLGRKRSLTLADCGEEPFVAYSPGLPAHDLQMQALALHGISPPQVLSASEADSILGFVEAGLGYTLVPSFLPDGPRGKGLRAVPLDRPTVEYPVHAVWRKDTPENPFLDALLEAAPRP